MCVVLQPGPMGAGEEVTVMFGYLVQGAMSGFVLLSHFKAINHATTKLDGVEVADSWSSEQQVDGLASL